MSIFGDAVAFKITDEQAALILEYKKYLSGKRELPPKERLHIPELKSAMAQIKEFYLWRHGPTKISDGGGLAGGVDAHEMGDSEKNIPLSSKGRADTLTFAHSHVGQYVRRISRKDGVYVATSDLNRAQETAHKTLALATYGMRHGGQHRQYDRLHPSPHVPFETRKGLHERRLGKDFGMPAKDGRDKLNDINYAPDGGETTPFYVRRVAKELAELVESAGSEGKKEIFIAGGHSDGLLTAMGIMAALGLAEKGVGFEGAIKSGEVLNLPRDASGKYAINVLQPKERPSRKLGAGNRLHLSK